MGQRRGGTIYFKVGGKAYDAVGNFTFGLGTPKREGLAGPDGVHGFKEMAQVPFIEGEVRDRADLKLRDLFGAVDESVQLELATGKVIALRSAWYAGEGTGATEEGTIGVRFEGMGAEEVA